jgi:hypothetical protein
MVEPTAVTAELNRAIAQNDRQHAIQRSLAQARGGAPPA